MRVRALSALALRWLWWIVAIVVVLYAIGRPVQLVWQSHYRGDREPWLQLIGPYSVQLHWQSREPQQSVVRYGLASTPLQRQQREESAVTEHRLQLTCLEPATRYDYQIDAGPRYSFTTAPLPTDRQPLRFWIQGDPGRYVAETAAVNRAAWHWMAQQPLPQRQSQSLFDLWFTTGDNAYPSGKQLDFQRHLFEPYTELLPTVGYWPTYGNHDARRFSFYRLFDFPDQAELGGVPSASEHYYSFDYGMVHWVMLDSHSLLFSVTMGLQGWLDRDLAANRQRWTVVLFHHPPYTRGSHDSDSVTDSRGRMVRARQQIVPILERHGVDLVLSGHSHLYERSHLMAGHYGSSHTFEPATHWLDSRSPYVKAADQRGSLYLVVGASYDLANGPLDHPAMAVATRERGSLVVDADYQQLTGHYIGIDGEVVDQFVLQKPLPSP
ncbi:metallophosphoesterase family protein [Ectothiorhodospiraceae bacterium BW-2]|nr:metallophosphoesterase family protein [Ectothiorhodospiraceae bacterium BW-2]